MATTIRVKVDVEIIESYPGDLGNPGKTHRWSKDAVYVNGNGTSQFNKAYSDITTLSAASATSYDLAAGVTDAQGAAITMSKLGFILAENRSSNAGDIIRIGGNTNAVPVFGGATQYLNLGAGGFALVVNPIDGWTVTAGTGDILDVTRTTTSTFDHALIVAGRS